ncbi:MAG: SWIM zinc finger domain-containing protein [Faecousia sp.]
MDWQKMFTPWILERGRNYWDDDCVESLYQDGNTVTAVVSGTEDYDVEIEMGRGGNIAYMSCTCPYAGEGNNCKHMAAVLFAMDEDIWEQPDIPHNGECFDKLPWQEALNGLSPEEMRQLLSELAQSDRGLQERIAALHGQLSAEAMEATWETQLAELPEKYTDRFDYIDYNHAYDFFMELDDFLRARLPRLLETEQVMEAFSLSCMVFETGMEQDVDDSDGGSSMLAGSCEDAWRKLLNQANPRQEQEMYAWFASHTHAPEWDYGSEVVEQFFYHWEWSAPLLEQNLRLLDTELAGEGNSEYRLKELLNWRANTMAALGMEPTAIDRFWAQYRHLPFVREREIELTLNEKNFDGAVRLLKESKELDKEDDFRVRNHSQKLISIYQQTGQTGSLREELRFQIFSCVQRDLTYIKLYRDIIPDEEWPALLDTLLRHETTKSLKYELLAFGEQYERLYQAIVQEGSFRRLSQYADILCRWSPEQVRDTYVRMLDGVMSRSSDRNMYRETIGYLQRVQQFPDGVETAKRLADSWRERFGRRKAMLDELYKAGY